MGSTGRKISGGISNIPGVSEASIQGVFKLNELYLRKKKEWVSGRRKVIFDFSLFRTSHSTFRYVIYL